ncbi:extracellular solute-binding protein [Candidatus Gracilibacteria bacterium]|nr:extracellular solute-binding protein [Candidatus Gracilibacteria bacterium]
MNINKIVFAVLGAIIVFLIVMLVIQLNRGASPNQVQRQGGDFNIWILEESRSNFEKIIRDFKDAFPKYSNTSIGIESFQDRNVYHKSITSALGLGIAPDIFMLNNTEFSPLQNHINGIAPSVVSPSDFRRDFHPVFADDLIVRIEEESLDILAGVPVGYQTPALFYNRRNFPRSSELLDWGRLNIEMLSVAERGNIIPIALGDGTTITRAEGIIQSFLAQEGVSNINEVQNTHTRQAFSQYRSLGLIGTQNYIELTSNSFGDTDIDYFTQGSVAAMIGYPKDLMTIADIGYQSNMLFVTPFPVSEGNKNAIAIDYDYFVIQKNTGNLTLAEDFMSYLVSERGQREFIEHFSHYIPAHSGLAIELEENNVHPSFNVVYRNFISDQTELVSFNVLSHEMFSRGLRDILNRENGFDSSFQVLKGRIICSVRKFRDFENLSTMCR